MEAKEEPRGDGEGLDLKDSDVFRDPGLDT